MDFDDFKNAMRGLFFYSLVIGLLSVAIFAAGVGVHQYSVHTGADWKCQDGYFLSTDFRSSDESGAKYACIKVSDVVAPTRVNQ